MHVFVWLCGWHVCDVAIVGSTVEVEGGGWSLVWRAKCCVYVCMCCVRVNSGILTPRVVRMIQQWRGCGGWSVV